MWKPGETIALGLFMDEKASLNPKGRGVREKIFRHSVKRDNIACFGL
jgi:hypothetical protein